MVLNCPYKILFCFKGFPFTPSYDSYILTSVCFEFDLVLFDVLFHTKIISCVQFQKITPTRCGYNYFLFINNTLRFHPIFSQSGYFILNQSLYFRHQKYCVSLSYSVSGCNLHSLTHRYVSSSILFISNSSVFPTSEILIFLFKFTKSVFIFDYVFTI